MSVAHALTLPPLLNYSSATRRRSSRSVQSYFVPQGGSVAVPSRPARRSVAPGWPGQPRKPRRSCCTTRRVRGAGWAKSTRPWREPCKPLRRLGGHASRVVRGGDSPTVLGLYLHRLNLRRAVTAAFLATSTRERPTSFDLRQHLAADLEPAAICGPVWLLCHPSSIPHASAR